MAALWVVVAPTTPTSARRMVKGRWWKKLTPEERDDLGFEYDGEWVWAREIMEAA